MKKKILCVALIIALLLTLVACGEIKYPNSGYYNTSQFRKQTEYRTLEVLDSVDGPVAVEFQCDKCAYEKTKWFFDTTIVFQCECVPPYTLHVTINRIQRE